jgi:anaerobic selenocysteine-containing dehydrogenase
MTKIKTHYRTCNLCEAMCGVKIEHEGSKILSIKGDENDPFSKGHICPKAIALQDLYEDPDRLRKPLEKTATGWKEISWKDAFKKAAKGLQGIQQQHGQNALGIYLGNPNTHNLGGSLTIKELLNGFKTQNRYTATSVDQLPHHIIAHHLFGHQLRIPVPDINRTDYMLIIGANPVASNGSIMTVAGVKDKLKDIKKRNGKVVVIDPRRTETAQIASEHHFIKPGSDVLLLLAMTNEVFKQKCVKPNRMLALASGYEAIEALVKNYNCEYAEQHTGIKAQVIKQLVKELSQNPKAVIYGRMGVSVQEFGLLSQYLIMVLNILLGNLDEEGGMMFPTPAADPVAASGPGYFAKKHSRVRNLPNFNGEFPVATLADEILTPGEGQIKGMLCVAGNPVLSTPNGEKLDTALESVDFMVSVDCFLNETSRHANIILPPVSAIERDHYDLAFHNLAVHNTAKFSKGFYPEKGGKHDWQIFLNLVKHLDKKVPFAQKIMRKITLLNGPNFMLNVLLKRSAYKGVSLSALKKAPHGIDLGPLKSIFPIGLKTKDKHIHLNTDFYFSDLARVDAHFKKKPPITLESEGILIGRRHVRSNNSWMHNSKRLVKGKNRCTLLMHPDHATAVGIKEGDMVKVTSAVNSVEIVAQISDEVMPGVVSIPHGFGHNRKGTSMKIAEAHAGVSVNDLTDENLLDQLSGNAAVNGVPVTLAVC